MIDLVVSAAAAAVLYKPFGIGGIVAGTGIGTSAAVFAQAYILRRKFGGLELGRLLSTVIRISIACAAMAAVSWVIWDVLNSALGEGTPAQIISLGTGMAIGGAVYLAVAQGAADRRVRADHAPPAATASGLGARCSGRVDTCWESSSCCGWSASPGSARPRCGAAGFPG